MLGGTSEATALAGRLSGDPRFAATLSLAGRTQSPRLGPIPTRIGGFGGADGLASYLSLNAIDVLIDATHPFAERISAHAVAAAKTAAVPLIALERAHWQPAPGDTWTEVPSLEAAALALPDAPERVFLTVGRQSLEPFAVKPQHHYVIRVIDPPEIPAAMTQVDIVTGRGPFELAAEIAFLLQQRVDRLVSKNSGGVTSYAKLAAARALALPVILIARPKPPAGRTVTTVEAVMVCLAEHHASLANRSE